MGIGVAVVDIKVNHFDTAEQIARAIERAEKAFGPVRVHWVHPDCGLWMLKRSVADRKIAAQPRDGICTLAVWFYVMLAASAAPFRNRTLAAMAYASVLLGGPAPRSPRSAPRRNTFYR
jgi:hypothetical protein